MSTPSDSAPAEGLYFLHIPKTAGVSLHRAIEAAFPAESICPHWLWDQLVTVPADRLRSYRVFRGHFHGDLERFLERRLRIFTLLRDPVERTVSSYYYHRGHTSHPLYPLIAALSLQEFCLHPVTTHMVRNYQAAYLARGLPRRDPRATWSRLPPGGTAKAPLQLSLELGMSDVDEGALAVNARAALDQLAAVGLTERFAESIARFNAILGCAMPVPPTIENATPERPPVAAVDPATVSVIRDLTRVDALLYREAWRRFSHAAAGLR
jgi:hypothetical protein